MPDRERGRDTVYLTWRADFSSVSLSELISTSVIVKGLQNANEYILFLFMWEDSGILKLDGVLMQHLSLSPPGAGVLH